AASDRAVARAGVLEAPAGPGLEQDVPVRRPRRVDVDAGDVAVEPLRDRAERVVVERVHLGRLEASLLGPAVPSLPDRRGAVGDAVAPGRVGLLEGER